MMDTDTKKGENTTMGTLRYAILGLLNQQSMTGYELTKAFETTLFEFWHARHSQIYPELKRLHQEGMVEFEITIAGTTLEKKLYSITPQGSQIFLDWLERQHPMGHTPKDEFRLQLFFTHMTTPQHRLELLQRQLEQHRERLRHLRHNQEKFSRVPGADSSDFSDYLVLLGAVMREETTCTWLETCIELCRK